jgi:hypothetical protein
MGEDLYDSHAYAMHMGTSVSGMAAHTIAMGTHAIDMGAHAIDMRTHTIVRGTHANVCNGALVKLKHKQSWN